MTGQYERKLWELKYRNEDSQSTKINKMTKNKKNDKEQNLHEWPLLKQQK